MNVDSPKPEARVFTAVKSESKAIGENMCNVCSDINQLVVAVKSLAVGASNLVANMTELAVRLPLAAVDIGVNGAISGLGAVLRLGKKAVVGAKNVAVAGGKAINERVSTMAHSIVEQGKAMKNEAVIKAKEAGKAIKEQAVNVVDKAIDVTFHAIDKHQEAKADSMLKEYNQVLSNLKLANERAEKLNGHKKEIDVFLKENQAIALLMDKKKIDGINRDTQKAKDECEKLQSKANQLKNDFSMFIKENPSLRDKYEQGIKA